MYEAGAFAITCAENTGSVHVKYSRGLHEGRRTCFKAEMSYTLNNAEDIIQGLSEKYGDALCVGAGTVLDAETARHAIPHGAAFIIALNQMLRSQECAIAIRSYAPGTYHHYRMLTS